MALMDGPLLARIRARPTKTMALLGIELLAVEQEAGRVRMALDATETLCNPAGNMQGGFVATALDEAASTAAIVKAGRRVVAPTIEFKVSFFAPARLGSRVICEGRVLKMGSRVTFTEADMLDAGGKLLARLNSSCMIVDLKGPGLFTQQPAG